ncbi:hypothetical protein [Comamonas sp.]|uniref:hypothetical protein n=1 Tax=Comamonas sp. TaxID=34028 RepID=UPI0028988CD9|nr:hypothetical protein [Comamonas sp.]
MSDKKIVCRPLFGLDVVQLLLVMLLMVFVIWIFYKFFGVSIYLWLNNHPHLASWVQAFGVISSFATALLVARIERRHIALAAKKESDQEEYRIRLASAMLLKKFCQTMVDITAVYMKSEGEYLIDAKSHRSLLESQLAQVNGIPLHSLSLEEREEISWLQDKGLQLLELLRFTEHFFYRNSEGKFIIYEEEYLLLVHWSVQNGEKIVEKVKSIQDAWMKGSEKYFDKWTK